MGARTPPEAWDRYLNLLPAEKRPVLSEGRDPSQGAGLIQGECNERRGCAAQESTGHSSNLSFPTCEMRVTVDSRRGGSPQASRGSSLHHIPPMCISGLRHLSSGVSPPENFHRCHSPWVSCAENPQVCSQTRENCS